MQTAADAAMRRALERAGNRLKGRAGTLRDTLRTTPPEYAARRVGPTMIADAGLSEAELLDGAFDDLVRRYPRWVETTANEAVGIYHGALGRAWVNTTPTALSELIAQNTERSAEVLANDLNRLALSRLYDPVGLDIDDVSELVPTGVVRRALAVAGGATDVVTFGDAAAAVSSADTTVGGVAVGTTFTEAFTNEGGSVEAWRWVYGPAQRDPFPPHLALGGKVFKSFTDPILKNSRAWPPFAYYIPGDHAHCKCDFEPVLVAPDGTVTADYPTNDGGDGATFVPEDDTPDVTLDLPDEPPATPPAPTGRTDRADAYAALRNRDDIAATFAARNPGSAVLPGGWDANRTRQCAATFEQLIDEHPLLPGHQVRTVGNIREVFKGRRIGKGTQGLAQSPNVEWSDRRREFVFKESAHNYPRIGMTKQTMGDATMATEQFESGWWSTGSEVHTLVHEYGHQVGFSAEKALLARKFPDGMPSSYTGSTHFEMSDLWEREMREVIGEVAGVDTAGMTWGQLAPTIRAELSAYAAKSSREVMAEAFADVVINGDAARPLSKAVAARARQLIDDELERIAGPLDARLGAVDDVAAITEEFPT